MTLCGGFHALSLPFLSARWPARLGMGPHPHLLLAQVSVLTFRAAPLVAPGLGLKATVRKSRKLSPRHGCRNRSSGSCLRVFEVPPPPQLLTVSSSSSRCWVRFRPTATPSEAPVRDHLFTYDLASSCLPGVISSMIASTWGWSVSRQQTLS